MQRKSHSNRSWVRLLKQVEISGLEEKEYNVRRIRYKSYYGTTFDGAFWDRHYRSKPNRSWKSYRKAQYK